MSDDVLALDLRALSDALRARRVSSVEVTRACLAAIESSQPRINSFIAWWPDTALAAAAAADKEIAARKWRGPLHGVPIAWKDVFLRRGKVATIGSKIWRDHVANTTATVIERLADAGAIFVGSLNLSEVIMSATGHNAHYGDCRNPWDPKRITGGSSSGSAASVAARLVPAALGSDTGGSVRIPAAICGVSGLKPTYGLVSRYGCFPRSWSLDVIGPLARTVRDCALVTQAIAGRDERDRSTAQHSLPRYDDFGGIDLRKVRIGVPYADPGIELDDAIRTPIEASVARFSEMGATMVEIKIPGFASYYDPANVVNKVEGTAIHARWMRTRRHDYSPAVIGRLEAGFCVPATHYLDALRARARLLREFTDSVFTRVDVLHFPVLGVETPTLADTNDAGSAAQPVLLELMSRFTRWVNYLGLPALSVPCGFTAKRMPVGFQIIGRPFSESRLFRIGHAYQQATNWHLAAPPR